MKPWRKKDFEIRGRFTGSRLAGRENEFVYEIFWNGKQFPDLRFSSKRAASDWLGRFLAKANALRAAYKED